MFDRGSYLEELDGSEKIKLITGLKRCGKTYLLKRIFRNYLSRNGVDSNHFIYISLEDEATMLSLASGKLIKSLKQKLNDGQTYYLILNEIQNLRMVDEATKKTAKEKDWIPLILDEFHEYKNARFFVICSNKKHAEEIKERYGYKTNEIHIDPISFKEYVKGTSPNNLDVALLTYAQYGGMPLTTTLSKKEYKEEYLRNLVSLTYYQDIKEREKIRNKKYFDILLNILATNTGNFLNQNKIADIFHTNYGLSVSKDTISKYLGFLEDSYLIRKVDKFDLKKREEIGGSYKYYFVDQGILNSLKSFKNLDNKPLMETLIFNELVHNGYKVCSGCYEAFQNDENGKTVRLNNEVDFLAIKNENKLCIQLSRASLEENQKVIKSILKASNDYKKILISNKRESSKSKSYLTINSTDFLLNEI